MKVPQKVKWVSWCHPVCILVVMPLLTMSILNIFGSLMLFYLIVILASSEAQMTFPVIIFYEADNR